VRRVGGILDRRCIDSQRRSELNGNGKQWESEITEQRESVREPFMRNAAAGMLLSVLLTSAPVAYHSAAVSTCSPIDSCLASVGLSVTSWSGTAFSPAPRNGVSDTFLCPWRIPSVGLSPHGASTLTACFVTRTAQKRAGHSYSPKRQLSSDKTVLTTSCKDHVSCCWIDEHLSRLLPQKSNVPPDTAHENAPNDFSPTLP